MSKLIILATFALCFIKYAFSLDCACTDLAALETGNIDASVSIRNCGEYMSENIKKYGINVNPFVLNILPVGCYTIDAKAGSPIADFKVKGCAPLGACPIVQGIFYSEVGKRGYAAAVKSATCTECVSPRCNQGA